MLEGGAAAQGDVERPSFAADPFAVRAKVPVIGPSNTAKGIPQIGEFVSRVSSPVAIVAPNAVKAAMDINKSLKRVVDLNAEIANSPFDFGMPQQKLYRSKVPRPTVDQDRLSAAQ